MKDVRVTIDGKDLLVVCGDQINAKSDEFKRKVHQAAAVAFQASGAIEQTAEEIAAIEEALKPFVIEVPDKNYEQMVGKLAPKEAPRDLNRGPVFNKKKGRPRRFDRR